MAAAQEYLQSLGGMASVEQYKIREDLTQIPFREEMGEANRTLLHCSESIFKINYTEMNEMKVATMKQMKAANSAMINWNSSPVFSGDIDSYLVNQLLEYDLLSKVVNVKAGETCKVQKSSVYPYYNHLMALANAQFAEPAQEMSRINKKKKDLTKSGESLPHTPQTDMGRPRNTTNLLASNKTPFKGVLIKKQALSTGQKPCCRINMDMFSLGNKFITYGGTAANVFNDIRSLDSVDFVWRVIREDVEAHDFKGRFGHTGLAFERYLVIFGGCGPHNNKMKKRNFYQETIFYDI